MHQDVAIADHILARTHPTLINPQYQPYRCRMKEPRQELSVSLVPFSPSTDASTLLGPVNQFPQFLRQLVNAIIELFIGNPKFGRDHVQDVWCNLPLLNCHNVKKCLAHAQDICLFVRLNPTMHWV